MSKCMHIVECNLSNHCYVLCVDILIHKYGYLFMFHLVKTATADFIAFSTIFAAISLSFDSLNESSLSV